MIRQERIERMLKELRYEIERGMMDGEIDESLTFSWIVPISKEIPDGIVMCRFETRPMHWNYCFGSDPTEPRLKVVK